MILENEHIPVTKAWINDVLKRRIDAYDVKIEDLFLITKIKDKDVEGDTFIETDFGKLRIFFRADMPKTKLAQILHTSKYPYPVKGNKYNYPTDTRPKSGIMVN